MICIHESGPSVCNIGAPPELMIAALRQTPGPWPSWDTERATFVDDWTDKPISNSDALASLAALSNNSAGRAGAYDDCLMALQYAIALEVAKSKKPDHSGHPDALDRSMTDPGWWRSVESDALMIERETVVSSDDKGDATRASVDGYEADFQNNAVNDALANEWRDAIASDGDRVEQAPQSAVVDRVPHEFDLKAASDWLDFMGIDSATVPLLLKDKDGDGVAPCGGLRASIGKIRALHDYQGWRVFALLQPTDGNGRQESNIAAGRVFSADYDKGEPGSLAIWPTSYVKTRRDRAQCHWVFDRNISVAHMERLQADFARHYAGERPGQCDPNAFRITQPFRLPGSVTHIDGEVFRVEETRGSGRVVSPEAFAEAFGLTPYVEPLKIDAIDAEPIAEPMPIFATNGGLRGRIEAVAPYVRFNSEPDQNRGAYYVKNASLGAEWGYAAFHVACKESDNYSSEAQCRKKWDAAPLKGLDPEKAAAFFFSRAKGRANMSAISKANPSGNGTAQTTDCLPTFSVNPKGYIVVQKARYGSKLWTDLGLPARAVHDAAHASHCIGRNNGRIVPDAAELAKATGLDARTVAKAIRELREAGLWRVTMEPTTTHPGMIELADAGTNSVEEPDGKRTYQTPAKVQWAEVERAKGAGAPMPNVIKIEHARFGMKAWTNTSVAGQEIVKVMACMKRRDDADEIVSPTRRIMESLAGLKWRAYGAGMASAEGNGLVVVVSRPTRGDGTKSFARAGQFKLVQASEAKARPVRKSDELRKSKASGSPMGMKSSPKKTAETAK